MQAQANMSLDGYVARQDNTTHARCRRCLEPLGP